MGRRRAGAWSRRRARDRRKELIREHWRSLLGMFAVIVTIGLVAVFVAGWLFGSWLAWFVAGAWYAGMVAMWTTMFELIDPVARHWWAGADGESSTARQLRYLERNGWRAVHNIMLATGDIDHVAVGPGGVVAIETKSSDAEWCWLSRQGVPNGWVKQVERSAARTQALVRQHTDLEPEVQRVVAAWVRGLADADPVQCHGVRVLHGSSLANELGRLDRVLDAEQIDQIHAALEAVAGGFDAHHMDRRAQRTQA